MPDSGEVASRAGGGGVFLDSRVQLGNQPYPTPNGRECELCSRADDRGPGKGAIRERRFLDDRHRTTMYQKVVYQLLQAGGFAHDTGREIIGLFGKSPG